MTTVEGQSLLDLAASKMGNVDALLELVQLNDFSGKMDSPAYLEEGEVDLAFSVQPDIEYKVDTVSPLYNERIVTVLKDQNITTGITPNYKRFSRIFSKQFH